MNNILKIKISRYVKTIEESLPSTSQIDTMMVQKPESDYLGEKLFEILSEACRIRGYKFQFYTSCNSSDFDYEVVVK